MLSLVPSPEVADARELLHLVESWRPNMLVLLELLLLPLIGLLLLVAGVYWGGLLVGAAVGFGLARYGPHWWPGKR